MPERHSFDHLPLLRRFKGPALLKPPRGQSSQTRANKESRQEHSEYLHLSAESLSYTRQQQLAQRQDQELPAIPQGIPILLQVDPNVDLDALRGKFSFEIVAEQEEGFVIVASEDIELASFQKMVTAFGEGAYGSATIASIHKLFDDPDQADRLKRILSEHLLAEWPEIDDTQHYTIDVGIACTGTLEIPTPPKRGKRDDDAAWAQKELAWSQARADAYESWDNIKINREKEIEGLVRFYDGEILHNIDGAVSEHAILPDSFTLRLKINGRGLRDIILNYPYIFEVVEPEDILLPQSPAQPAPWPGHIVTPIGPDDDAPAVCVIDSGIQESHILIESAIDNTTSHCFLPGKNADDVGDFVRPGGHGTRVAGAILYGETIVNGSAPQLPFWIQNARVLDEYNRMPEEMFPAEVIRAAIERFYNGPRHTRIFNHSINANAYCRTRYMSSWAAEIDLLCAAYDVLVVQSAGNLPITGFNPYIGVHDHLIAGREYPAYLYEPSARIANPGQSLQALTVGSIAYGAFRDGDWRTFAQKTGHPSAFSRSGPSIWNVIKPELVEYGGDDTRTDNSPPDVQAGGVIATACPELVRSAMFDVGPPFARDSAGTSFSAPKVTRIAANLQRLLPNEPALLYRALLVQSARWPEWAETTLNELRRCDPRDRLRNQQLLDETTRIIRSIGYGIPDETRATVTLTIERLSSQAEKHASKQVSVISIRFLFLHR